MKGLDVPLTTPFDIIKGLSALRSEGLQLETVSETVMFYLYQ